MINEILANTDEERQLHVKLQASFGRYHRDVWQNRFDTELQPEGEAVKLALRILDNDGNQCAPGGEGAVTIRLPLPPGTLPTLYGLASSGTYSTSYNDVTSGGNSTAARFGPFSPRLVAL